MEKVTLPPLIPIAQVMPTANANVILLKMTPAVNAEHILFGNDTAGGCSQFQEHGISHKSSQGNRYPLRKRCMLKMSKISLKMSSYFSDSSFEVAVSLKSLGFRETVIQP